MIAETSIPLFVLCTSSLTAAFTHYNKKYRNFIKKKRRQPNKNPNKQVEMTKQKQTFRSLSQQTEFFEKTILFLFLTKI
jgi:hypothetical protein